MNALERIREIATRVARARGLEIFDLELARERGTQVLRLVLDTPWPVLSERAGARVEGPALSERAGARVEGAGPTANDSVTLEDCARISEELSAILDVEDPLPDRYTLEVSSPGLDRPLRHRDDYVRFEGRLAKIVLSEPVNGQTAFAGRLRGIEGDEVLFESEGGKPVRLPIRLISRARLDVEF